MRKGDTPIFLPRNYIVWYFMIWLLWKTYRTPKPEYIMVVYFIMIGFILCEIYVSYVKTQISIIVEDMPKHISKEEKITLKLTVINRGFLPAPYTYIFLKESYHIEPEQIKCLCVTLPPHGRKTYTFAMQAKYSGKEKIGIEKVVVSDFMELARRKLDFSWQQEMIILPQPVTLSGVDALLHSMANHKNENQDLKKTVLMEQGEVSYELKPYVEGQSQRLMHWKLAAQRDIYMVRQREQIIKMRRERLVVIDPVVILNHYAKPSLAERFWNPAKIRRQWHVGCENAKLADKLVNGAASYLLEVLKMGESILLFYYEGQKWEQIRLHTMQDLEMFSDKISGSILSRETFNGMNKPEARWPQTPARNYAQEILITAGVDAALRVIVEEQPGLKVLELQKRSVVTETAYNQYWYLTNDYQIVHNG